MPRRVPGSSLTISLSTNGTLMPGWMAQHVAATAGIGGIDLDTSTIAGRWFAARTSATEQYVPVRSIWVPRADFQTSRSRRIIESVQERQQDRPALVVVTLPTSATLRSIAGELDAVRSAWADGPVALGLASGALRGGRPHLVQLGTLRHFAEEWDLAIALDLAGKFDPTWEAEAAIARVGGRLRLLRLRTSAPSRAAVGRDRVACRALHATVDRGHEVDIAICPTRRFAVLVAPRAAAKSARQASDYIADRAAVHAASLREGIDHFEGSHTKSG